MHLDLNNFRLGGVGSGPHAVMCCVPPPPPTVLEGTGGACGPQDLIYILYGPYRCRSCRSLIYVIITGFNLVSLTYRIKLFDNIYMCTVELQLSKLQSSGSFWKINILFKMLINQTNYIQIIVCILLYCSVVSFDIYKF